MRYPVGAFATVAVALYLTVWWSTRYLPRHSEYPIREPLSFRGAGLLEGWVRFDGGWYHSIVTDGYFHVPGEQSSIAFFPGYPTAVAAMSRLVGDVYLAGILVTLLCGLALAVVFYRWCVERSSVPVARTALLLLLVFPYAWYLYGAMYADALFVLCAVGAFALLGRDRPVLAGLVAAVATATRPVGIAMVVGLVAVLLEQRGAVRITWLDRLHLARTSPRPDSQAGSETDAPAGAPITAGDDSPLPGRSRRLLGVEFALGRLRPRDAGVLLSVGGLVGWMLYQWVAFGDPTLFVEVQSAPGWDQGQGPSTWFKEPWIERLGDLPTHLRGGDETWPALTYTLGVTFQAALVFGFLALVPVVMRRIGWGYGVYVVALVAIPVLGSKDWQGTGRYVLGAFPVFLALAWWLVDGGHRWIRNAWLAVSAAALVFLTSAYARGYYLA
ncbi:MAG: hypothetical protein JJU45_01650 [Acidimicrobiia bacterium]|nr:hypothetical protein [Acidimicrobiia bacterium]